MSPRMRLAGRRSSTDIWIAVIDEGIEMFDCLPDTHSELFSGLEIVAGLDVVFDGLLLMLLGIKVFYAVASVGIVSKYPFFRFNEAVLVGGIDLGGRGG